MPEVEVNFTGNARGDSDVVVDYVDSGMVNVRVGDDATIIFTDGQFEQLFHAMLPWFTLDHNYGVADFEGIVRAAIIGECNQRKNQDLRADDAGVRKAIAARVVSVVYPVSFLDGGEAQAARRGRG